MKFPKRITDYVRLEWTRNAGTIAVVLEDWLFPLLDLTELPYKAGHNAEEARHYVGGQLCNYLKNRASKESILNDYWMNQYLSRAEIQKAIEVVTENADDVIKGAKAKP